MNIEQVYISTYMIMVRSELLLSMVYLLWYCIVLPLYSYDIIHTHSPLLDVCFREEDTSEGTLIMCVDLYTGSNVPLCLVGW